MRDDQRPLSPHLQIYKLPLAALLSISHRATGVFLSVGTLILIYWLVCLAAGPQQFATIQGWLGSLLGQAFLFAWSASLYFHLCNGIRHLFWDVGYGFDKAKVEKTNVMVVGSAVAMTIATWLISYAVIGG